MSAPQELQAYIDRLQRRLRIAALSRGAAVVAGAALGATLLLVFIANAFAFSGGSITAARFALVCILLCATGFGLAIPLRQLTRRSAVALVEQKFPQFKQRLMTFADKDQADPFVEPHGLEAEPVCTRQRRVRQAAVDEHAVRKLGSRGARKGREVSFDVLGELEERAQAE